VTHEIKPIRNDEDHAEALAAVEDLWSAEPGTPEHDRLEILAMLIDEYEPALADRVGGPRRSDSVRDGAAWLEPQGS
jgi:antitoxin component HigA of HigAB toxin-antitoxin module